MSRAGRERSSSISEEVTRISRGRPVFTSRPLTVMETSSGRSVTQPMVILISSAVVVPMTRPWRRRI